MTIHVVRTHVPTSENDDTGQSIGTGGDKNAESESFDFEDSHWIFDG